MLSLAVSLRPLVPGRSLGVVTRACQRRPLSQVKRGRSFKEVADRLEKSTAISPVQISNPPPPRRRRPSQRLAAASAASFKEVVEQSDLTPDRQADESAEKFLLSASEMLEDGADPTCVNWGAAMKTVEHAERAYPVRRPETEELEDLQEKCITYNLSKVVNASSTLRRLVDLGVAIGEWEEHETGEWTDIAVRIDFDRDVASKVRMLADVVPADAIGHILTKNAPLLLEDDARLATRIRYLRSKGFTGRMVSAVLSNNPYWLSYSTEEVDARLGYFQKTFSLTGDEVRGLASRLPKLITWGGVPGQIRLNKFVLLDVCGFHESDIKRMLLRFPILMYQTHEQVISDMFSLLHNEVGFSYRLLRKTPEVLVENASETRPRHEFLVALGRATYNPEKPLFISPSRLVLPDDAEFCSDVAKVPVHIYNEFLKTV